MFLRFSGFFRSLFPKLVICNNKVRINYSMAYGHLLISPSDSYNNLMAHDHHVCKMKFYLQTIHR